MRNTDFRKRAKTSVTRLLPSLVLLKAQSRLLPLLFITTPIQALMCPTFCAQTTDYQHSSSLLHFSRSHTSTVNDPATASNSEDHNSRHRFDIVLTQNDSTTVIFDHLGIEHIFDKDDSGNFISQTQSGSLTIKEGLASWTDSTGDQYQFQGSFLTRYIDNTGQSLSMRYQQRRLQSIVDDFGNTLTLNYENNRLTELTTPEGQTVKTPVVACFSDNEDTDRTCDSQENPIPDFERAPNRNGTTRIDARSSSCESYFIEYFGTERGVEIELGLASLPPYESLMSTVRSYPIVDFIDDNRLLVVRSRDLANHSFNDVANPNALLHRLMRDGREIETRFLTPLNETGQVSATEDGQTTTIQLGSIPPNITLQLVIRHQIASPAHWEQIAQARDQLLAKYGIVLEVVIIP